MIEYEYRTLFQKNSADREIRITDDENTVIITNEELYADSFELTEKLCEEETLVFGSCIASVIKFTAAYVYTSLKGKWINVSMVLDGKSDIPFQVGRYKVDSDKPTADMEKRKYVAYDALYDILIADVADWYNSFFTSKVPEAGKETATYTLKEFRDSFFKHFGLSQEETTLPNDGMTVEKTVAPVQLSGKTVINAICEINGCFGRISRENEFRYVFLGKINRAVYPSETRYLSSALYPVLTNGAVIANSEYIPPLEYEDYETELISGLVIRQEENDIGATAGDGENKYIIQDNFLVYGKNAAQLSEVAGNVFAKIKDIYYRPFSGKMIGNPCIEVGDVIRIYTSNKLVNSYVLQRTLKGVQASRDFYQADGKQKLDGELNNVSNAIIQLKGKTNKLTMTVDETISELEDLENETNTRFEQTSDEISALATRTTKNEQDITSVNIRAEGLSASIQEVDGKVTKNSTQIEANASGLSTEVTRAKEAEASLNVRADEIKTSLTDFETGTNSKFTQMSNQISLKVESGEVQNMIDLSIEGATIKANQIKLEGYTTINGGFSIDTDGNVILKNSSMWAFLSPNAFVVGSQTLIGDGNIWTGNISCTTINDSKPITVANLGDYVGGTSTVAYIMSDLEDIWEQLNMCVRDTELTSTLSDYVTTSSLSSTLSSYAKTSTLSTYAKKSDLSGYLTSSDLSGYVTSSELSDTLDDYATVQGVQQSVGSTKVALQAETSALRDRVSTLESNESDYATKTSVNNAMSRIGSLESRVTALEASL